MSEGGYPLDWFCELLDESLKCGICCKVLREPRVTPCGHIYCSPCLTPWLDSYGVCPKRCEEVEVDSLRTRIQLDAYISGLYTHCKNKRAGCTEQVPLIEKHLHENICPHRSILVGDRTNSRNSSGSSGSSCNSRIRREASPALSRAAHKRADSFASLTSSIVSVAAVGRTTSAGSCTAKRGMKSAGVLAMVSSRCELIVLSNMETAMFNAKLLFLKYLLQDSRNCSTHTFRLKRGKAKEPLGLVLVSGDKVSWSGWEFAAACAGLLLHILMVHSNCSTMQMLCCMQCVHLCEMELGWVQ